MSEPSLGSKPDEPGLILPAYVLLRPEGVFIDLAPPPPARETLQLFVDRIFSSETRFAGLDYAKFLQMLYGADPITFPDGKNELRIADKIVRFPPERAALYKSVKVIKNGEQAEYMFEPAFIETVTDEPIYGEPGEDGVKPVIDHKRNVERHTAQLDFDEFVASMWVKGVRFGIDAKAVHEAIQKGMPARITVAFHQEPADSKDAELAEESNLLHQDNAPLILPNGKADLRRARNRFPQVAKGTPMLRKVPRVLGKPGYRVTGAIIEPRVPEDIDLKRLAGPGTRVEQTPKGELLVADMDGFVDLDEETSAICIVTKIEDKGGISLKATGDIRLDVDDFTEHGEVQEGRVVEGKHMTFRSDVFGTVIAKDGNLELERNLSGGRAKSVGGNIRLKGKCISAVLEAWDGTITAEFAEESLIIGKSVSIARAVNCEIVAEELHLGVAEGCAIAGKKLQITSTNAHKNRETVVSVLLPDIAAYDRQIAEAKQELAETEAAIQAKIQEIAATQSDTGFSRYLAMAKQVQSGAIKLTPEQQAGWQKIVNQFAPLQRGTDSLTQKCGVLEDAIKHWAQERDTCEAGEHCTIATVLGDTLVRKVSSNLGMPFFRELPEHELRVSLKQLGVVEERIFFADSGNVDWHFTLPGTPAEAG